MVKMIIFLKILMIGSVIAVIHSAFATLHTYYYFFLLMFVWLVFCLHAFLSPPIPDWARHHRFFLGFNSVRRFNSFPRFKIGSVHFNYIVVLTTLSCILAVKFGVSIHGDYISKGLRPSRGAQFFYYFSIYVYPLIALLGVIHEIRQSNVIISERNMGS